MKQKVLLGITGASGSVYANRLMERLLMRDDLSLSLVFSSTGERVWQHELNSLPRYPSSVKVYDDNDLFAAPSSGSSNYDTMIILPCSMSSLGKIANGIADTLITRSASVMLKERKCLLLAVREMPYSLVHINNMQTVALTGGILLPCSPSFYGEAANCNPSPPTAKAMIDSVVDKILNITCLDKITNWQD